MASFSFKELGNVIELGSAYTSCGAGTSGRSWQGALHVANLTGAEVLLKAFIADVSWATGEPTGGTLVAALAQDIPVPANGVLRLGPFQIESDNELVLFAGTATSLDCHAFGTEETP